MTLLNGVSNSVSISVLSLKPPASSIPLSFPFSCKSCSTPSAASSTTLHSPSSVLAWLKCALLFFSTFFIAAFVSSCLNIFSNTSFFLVLWSPILITMPAVMLHVMLQQRITVVRANGRTWYEILHVQVPSAICNSEWQSNNTTTSTSKRSGKA